MGAGASNSSISARQPSRRTSHGSRDGRPPNGARMGKFSQSRHRHRSRHHSHSSTLPLRVEEGTQHDVGPPPNKKQLAPPPQQPLTKAVDGSGTWELASTSGALLQLEQCDSIDKRSLINPPPTGVVGADVSASQSHLNPFHLSGGATSNLRFELSQHTLLLLRKEGSHASNRKEPESPAESSNGARVDQWLSSLTMPMSSSPAQQSGSIRTCESISAPQPPGPPVVVPMTSSGRYLTRCSPLAVDGMLDNDEGTFTALSPGTGTSTFPTVGGSKYGSPNESGIGMKGSPRFMNASMPVAQRSSSITQTTGTWQCSFLDASREVSGGAPFSGQQNMKVI